MDEHRRVEAYVDCASALPIRFAHWQWHPVTPWPTGLIVGGQGGSIGTRGGWSITAMR
jgi:hypothetical protein